jgi:hypothetical protein
MASILKFNKAQHTNSTDAMSIDTSGNVTVTQPLQSTIMPAWRVSLSADQTVSAASTWTKVVFDDIDISSEYIFNQDVTFSGGTATITHAGVYQVNTSIRADALTTDSGYFILAFRINGATSGASDTYFLTQRYNSTYQSFTLSDVFKCAVGDTLAVWGFSSNDASWHYSSNVCHFSGARIG